MEDLRFRLSSAESRIQEDDVKIERLKIELERVAGVLREKMAELEDLRQRYNILDGNMRLKYFFFNEF